MKLIRKSWQLLAVVLVLSLFTGASASAPCQQPVSSPIFTSANPSETAINTGVLGLKYLNPDEGRYWTQDKYEGVLTDPISIHKYLYVEANPVNAIDPSGLMQLNELQFGQLVQRTLAAGARLNLRVVVQKTGCILMYSVADEIVGQGIYIFLGETGTPYVGKTQREFIKRFREHLRTGALRNLEKVLGFIGVDGASKKLALRDIEQYILDTVLKVQGRPGGLKGLQNQVNPVREILRKTVKFCP